MKFIVKVLVAAIVAAALACVLIVHGASDNVVLSVYFSSAIAVAAVLGVFDESVKSRHINFKDTTRHYEQAA